MKKVLSFVSHLFGFNKLTKYENDYLHDSNIRSSVYMSSIVIILELWMIIRQFHKNIIPALKAGDAFTKAMFTGTYLSIFILILLTSLTVVLFCLFYSREKVITKTQFIVQTTLSSICSLYSFFIFFEYFRKGNTPKAYIMNTFLIVLYALAFIISISSIAYGLLRYKKHKNFIIFEHLVVTGFALLCLSFGIRVSYNDFLGGKEIICFLTMVIYIGCLLIYRPFVTLLILAACFIGFYGLIMINYAGGFEDGDKVNYITFFVSLTTICFAIYHGRLKEATKSAALEKSAKIDELTSIYNFNYFIEKAKTYMAGLVDNYQDNVFLFIDVHNFKAFNDQRGFEEGNKFLITVANLIHHVFRDSLYARQADDHFVVLTNSKDVTSQIDKLNDLVNNLDEEILLGINCGAFRIINKEDDPRVCIDRARYATHLIKKSFDKHYIEYDKTMDEAYHKRLYIINNIDNAAQKGWIVPFYQPVVWSKDKKLCGCEALCRWFDPVYGQLYPNEFVPVLEEYRLIHKLDYAIFEAVCKDLHDARTNGLPVVPVSLNFSRLDFELMDAVTILEDLVKKYDLPKHLIHVEITESALIDSFNTLTIAINKLKELGYSLWLDDFGSGYSSLNVLKDYSFDVLKIDMKFLSNLKDNEKSKTLIECIIQMADRISMLTLTEGVETAEEADFLSSVGCGRLQGYLFGKPIPKDELYRRINNKEFEISTDQL